jgi:hypothetical protein
MKLKKGKIYVLVVGEQVTLLPRKPLAVISANG